MMQRQHVGETSSDMSYGRKGGRARMSRWGKDLLVS